MRGILRKFKFFKHLSAKLTLREAIRKTMMAHRVTGQRYYILPSNNGTLLITTRNEFRKLKRDKRIANDMNMMDVKAAAFFCTDNKDVIKVQEFMAWYDKYNK